MSIGSNLLGVTDVLTLFLELYDQGLVKQKLTKNTSENQRGEELDGKTPTNMLLFGTPSKLLDGGQTEDQFYSFLDTGYARRCLFGYGQHNRVAKRMTPTEIYEQLTRPDNDAILTKWARHFYTLADPAMFNWKMEVSDAVSIAILTYRLECEAAAELLSDHEEIKKSELSHRYFKALKLAGAYAFIDSSTEVEMGHLLSAIKLVEESGEAFQTILNREKTYVKLAKYIAGIKDGGHPCGSARGSALLQVEPDSPQRDDDHGHSLGLQEAHHHQEVLRGRDRVLQGGRPCRKPISTSSCSPTRTTGPITICSSGCRSISFMSWLRPRACTGPTIDFRQGHRAERERHCRLQHGLHRRGWRDRDPGSRGAAQGVPLPALHHQTPQPGAAPVPADVPDQLFPRARSERVQGIHERDHGLAPLHHGCLCEPEGQEMGEFPGRGSTITTWRVNSSMCCLSSPKTSRNEQYRQQNQKLESLDNMERWFANRMVPGNRNNQMIKFALCLVDAGWDLPSVQAPGAGLRSEAVRTHGRGRTEPFDLCDRRQAIPDPDLSSDRGPAQGFSRVAEFHPFHQTRAQ